MRNKSFTFVKEPLILTLLYKRFQVYQHTKPSLITHEKELYADIGLI